MKRCALTRREFLRRSAAAATVACTANHALALSSAELPIRPNVATFNENSQNMLTYARAVKEMRARSNANLFDPLGWMFWANIHGMPGDDTNFHETWKQCEHGTRWFFPWHRGYLMFFERIIRKVSADDTFVLPYWKWDNADTRALPSLFRMTTHLDLKELFYARFSWVNEGQPLPSSPFTVDLPNAMAELGFDSVSSFEPGFSLSLDMTPHGSVHTRIGGEMQSIGTSARDPIFWLHHANVDRLWNRWLELGGGRANPTDPEWLDSPLLDTGEKKPIRFPDENGSIVQLTVKEVMEMAEASYRYDDDPTTPGPVPPIAFAAPRQVPRQDSVPVASASNTLFPLGDQKSSVAVALGTVGQGQLRTTVRRMAAATPATPPKKTRIVLELQGVQVSAADPGIDFDVLIRPKGSTEDGVYVGNLNFFQIHEHKRGAMAGHGAAQTPAVPPKFDVSFNISKAVKQLTGDGERQINELEVIFQPSRRPENARPLPKIGFERVVIHAAR